MKSYHLFKMLEFTRFRAQALKISIEERGQQREGLPLPPPLLRYRVHGALDRESFLSVGARCSQDIKSLLALVGYNLNSFDNILDFGCGSGRVMRFFHDSPGTCHLYGSDIDEQAIEWCRRNLPFAHWSTNGAMPPLDYPDDKFDCIVAISVFTHLNSEMQVAWLHELKRVLRPGGILLLSIHGVRCESDLDDNARQTLSESGFLYTVDEAGIFNRLGLPDFYQITFHTPEYIQHTYSQIFKILRFVEGGINTLQDAVILQKE